MADRTCLPGNHPPGGGAAAGQEYTMTTITAYLDMTQALQAYGLGEFLQRHGGDTVYLLSWLGASGQREGFASAASATSAKAILRAHETGFRRTVTSPTARRWGTRDQLADWARKRCGG